MKRLTLLNTFFAAMLALSLSFNASAAEMDKESQATFDTVMAFMGAMGKGDMETMTNMMDDDMVWQNEGDKAMPWIGPWKGKEEIMKFLGITENK